MKNKFILALICILTIIYCSGCNKYIAENIDNKIVEENSIKEVAEDEKHSNILRIPLSYKKSFNPYIGLDKTWVQFNKLIYEGLFEYDENYMAKPYLVELLSSNDEGTNFNFKIKEGIKFHNGDNLTVDDIVFTYNFFKQEYLNTPYKEFAYNVFETSGGIGNQFRIQKISSSEFSITTDRPYVNLFDFLTIPIISKKTTLGNMPDGSAAYRKIANIKYEFKVNGTGPYKYSNYSVLKLYELAANENWWKGKVKIEKIEGIIISTEDAIFTTVLSGIADVAKTEYEDWGKHSENNEINTYEYPDSLFDSIIYNGKSKYFSNKQSILKKYIDASINRKSILSNVYLGHGYETNSPINPLIVPLQNSDKIKKEESKPKIPLEGYEQKNENGFWINEKGELIELKIITFANDNSVKIAELVKKDLEKNGIKIKVEAIELWEDYMAIIATEKYDLAILTMQTPMMLDFKNIIHSTGLINKWSGFSGELDNAVSEYMRQNPKNKKEAIEKLMISFEEYKPFSPLVFRNNAVIINKKIKGTVTPYAYNIYRDIENWSID